MDLLIRFSYRWLGLVVLAITGFLPHLKADRIVIVDPDQRYQEIEGWGTCMASWSLGSSYYWDARWRNAYRDLGCNILRVAMQKGVLLDASGNYSIPVSLTDDLQANINKMNFTRSDVDVFGDFAQWLAQNALEPDRVKITGSLWTPPHWMKGPNTKSVNGQSTPYLTRGT